MRTNLSAIIIALLFCFNAAAVDCGPLLTGGPGAISRAEQFYRLVTSYIAINPQSQSLVAEILKAKTPVNPFATATTTSAMQMKLALEDLVRGFSNADWAEAKILFKGQNSKAKKQATVRDEKSQQTEKIRRLELRFADRKQHSSTNIPITSAFTFNDRTFAAQAHDQRIQIYELDPATGLLESRLNRNGEGMVEGTPIFLPAKDGLYVASLSQKHIHLYKYDLDDHLTPVQHLDSAYAGSFVKTALPDGRIAVWVYDGPIPENHNESVRLFEFDPSTARLTHKGYQRSDKFKSVELMKETEKELFFITGQQHPVIYTLDKATLNFKESWVKKLNIQTAPASALIANSGLVVGGSDESVDLWDFLNKVSYDVDSVDIEGDHAYGAPFDVIDVDKRSIVVSATAGALTVTEIQHAGTSLKILKRYPFEFFEQQITRYSVVLPEVDGRILLMYTDLSTIELFELDKKTLEIRFVQSMSGNFRGKPYVVQTPDQIYVTGVGFDGNLFVMSVLGSVR